MYNVYMEPPKYDAIKRAESISKFAQQINPTINKEIENPSKPVNPHGNTSEDQNSEIPLKWKPIPSEPVPVVRCTFVRSENHSTKPGQRCKAWSWRGLTTCYTHSARGGFANINALREATLEAAQLKLLETLPDAIDVQVDLMHNSGSDAVRQTASKELIKLAMGQEQKITVDVNHNVSRVEVVSQKLKEIASKSVEVVEIIEADVVEDDPQ